MKANEVRVGNLFLWGVNLLEIKGIHSQTYGQDHNRKHHFYVDVLNNKSMNYGPLDSDEIDPIPLNEEWLLKFGLEMSEVAENIVSWQNHSISLNTYSKTKVEYYWLRYYHHNVCQRIKFAHELQNLYFSLIGKELELVVS